MKLKVALIVVLFAGLITVLSACSGSKAVKTTQEMPTGSAGTPMSKANTTGSERRVQTGPAISAEKESVRPIVMLKDVHFDFDRYVIKPEDAEILKRDYAWFEMNPDTYVRIEGNCDERGSIEYNLALGQKRADAAKDFLANLGVSPKLIKTVSYGKEKPVNPNHNEHAWAENRRDHFEPEK